MFLIKETALVHLLGITRIPMIFFCSPRVEQLDETGVQIRISLNYRTKNHWGTMYFGALAVGADLAGGLGAMHFIRTRHPKVTLLFKDFQANFLKRADGDVLFTCSQGQQIAQAVEEADRTLERVNIPLRIVATVPDKHGADPVAEFALSLSLKRK